MRAARAACDTRPMPNANARSGSASKGELAARIVILGQYLVLANPILNTIRYLVSYFPNYGGVHGGCFGLCPRDPR